MQFFRKLFIPCFVRSENVSKGVVCSSRGLKDPSQRCSERKKKHRKRRSACISKAPIVVAPKPEEKPPQKKIEAEPPKIEPPKPPESKPPESKPPEPKQPALQQPIPCPHCNKPTTIIICDSCNRCHKVQCGS